MQVERSRARRISISVEKAGGAVNFAVNFIVVDLRFLVMDFQKRAIRQDILDIFDN